MKPTVQGVSRQRQPTAEQLAAALYASNDLICSIDLDRRFTSWNAGCEQLYGWTADEVLGERIELYVPESEREQFERIVGGVFGGDDVPAAETARRTKDGRAVTVSLRFSPVRDEFGEVIGGLAVGRDISLEVLVRRDLEQSRSHLSARLEHTAVAHATLAPDGRYTFVNDAYCQLVGWPREELLGQPGVDASRGEAEPRGVSPFDELLRGDRAALAERRTFFRPDGTAAEVVAHASAIRTPEGGLDGIALTLQDITDLLATQSTLTSVRARWRALSRHAADVGFLADAEGTLLSGSEALGERFGYSREQVIGRVGWDFFHPDDIAPAREAWDQVAAGELDRTSIEARVRHADGRWVWILENIADLRDDPHVGAIVATVRDISDRKSAEQRLGDLAMYDQLTGLANRALLLDRASYAIERSRQVGGSCALLLLGLDDFTHVNAELGHAAGDEVLNAVAQLLGAVLDPLDTLARVEGDRFAVLVESVAGEPELRDRAGDLQALLAVGVGRGSRRVALGTSVGAVIGWGGDAAAMLAAAESALRAAKSSGRERVAVFTETDRTAARARRADVADLRRGLAAAEFVLHYQPVIDLSTDQPVGVEALVRWQHPDRGLLAPAAFLDLAEDTGLVVELGAAVLMAACRAAAGWADVGGRQLSVAVNLSMRQIAKTGVVDLVRGALAESGLDPCRLMLEVTETAVTRDVTAATDTLLALRKVGVDIAMDDFGTGYSSLTYLRRFPVTAVKIDRSFVSGLGVDTDDEAIVDSVVTLAGAVGIDCIAEGVETRAQLDHLLNLRCTQGQGYLWSPPLPELELLAWLDHRRPVPPAEHHGRTTLGRRARTPSKGRWQHTDPLLVDRIRGLLDEGASLHTISAALNADGTVSPSGARWHPRSVARVIANATPADPPPPYPVE